MIAEMIFNVAKDLFGIFTQLDESRLRRTARVADYFSNLAQTVEDTSAYLKKGNYPNGECAELRFHADKMVSTIGDLIGMDEAKEYASKVLYVWEIEKMHEEIISLSQDDKQEKLKVLDEAAGYFRGVSAHLRVSK